MIFDESTLRKLNQLTLAASRVRAGMIKGERRSTKRGTSIEFADYRNYTPGDDLRRLDWNVYARLDRPFIKLLEEEEDLAVHILLDLSGSMAWGEGEIEQAALCAAPCRRPWCNRLERRRSIDHLGFAFRIGECSIWTQPRRPAPGSDAGFFGGVGCEWANKSE